MSRHPFRTPVKCLRFSYTVFSTVGTGTKSRIETTVHEKGGSVPACCMDLPIETRDYA